MKNTFGESIKVTLFGESHGDAIGAVIDGMTPGVPVSEELIERQLARRRPATALDTPRQEPDRFQILSGVFAGKTTGTPICICIPNTDAKSGDYAYGLARPSHADYAAFCKYHGNEDYRGGGHFSGRITAALVAAGAVLFSTLKAMNIRIGTHILRCADVWDRPFAAAPAADIGRLQSRAFPVLLPEREAEMAAKILEARAEGDSVGGITQTAICGIPAGVGEPWFDSVEGLLAHAVFSIGGVKGIEFGAGFSGATLRGSGFNDAFRMEGDSVVTRTNNNGGINGGITNGMPIVFNCAVKPTPSIGKAQDTVDFVKGENASLEIKGRHDPAIIRRVCPVIDSVAAIVICDLLAQRYGTDVFLKGAAGCSMD